MEAMKVKFFIVALMMMALMAIEKVAAADAESPAPGPSSDAALFVPTFFASFIALAFGFLFWALISNSVHPFWWAELEVFFSLLILFIEF